MVKNETVPEEGMPEPNTELEKVTPGDNPEPEPEAGSEPESEDDPVVPTLVLDHAPSMAEHWGSMSEDQRQGLMGDLVRQIDQGETEGKDADVDDQGEAIEPTESQPAVETPDPAPAPYTIDPATEAELHAACQEMNIEVDSSAGQFLRKMMEQSGHALTSIAGIGREVGAYNNAIQDRVLKAEKRAQETDARVISIADENELVAACEAHAPDFRGMKKDEVAKLIEDARKLKTSGRARKFHDAVSIALWERKKAPAKPATTAAQRETEKVASALSEGGRSRASAGTAKLSKGLNKPSEVMSALMQRFAETGKFS
ncbi:hypothetical protein LCGC14_1631120 [marine sediment metagenome]|uniref:Uncharacterized protein n=1 Tax=marine sediment metagenome TaxID=412755 RepID=A0A0F9I2U0_9ZZZZ